jgi:tRNA U55 pseudouridine synthase TruB
MLSTLEGEGAEGARWILPLEQLLADIPAVALNDRDSERARHGADVPADDSGGPGVGAATTRRRLFDATGHLVAIGELRPGDVLHPVIVLV